MLRWRAASIPLAWLLAAVTACGGGNSGGLEPAAGEPELGEVLDDPSPSELQLPLDQYLWSASEFATLENAEDVLIRQCMGEQGYQFELAPRPTGDASENLQRYTLVDREAAQSMGYAVPRPSGMDAVVEAQEADADMAPAEYAAFQGCLTTARDQIGSSLLAQDDTISLQNLGSDSFELSLQDSRVRDAFDAWSDCMDEAGFDYADPQEPPADEAWAGREVDREPSQRELSVAAADVECKQEANVTGIWLAVESAYQTRMVEENGERLGEVQGRIDEALQQAAQVLEDPALAGGAG